MSDLTVNSLFVTPGTSWSADATVRITVAHTTERALNLTARRRGRA